MSTQSVEILNNEQLDSRQKLEHNIDYAIVTIGTNKKLLKEKKKELKDKLLSDADYFQAEERVKAATKIRTDARREAVKRNEDIARLANDIASTTADTKMWQLSLSDYLLEFESKTGQTSFPTSTGEVVEFEKVARLKREEGE